MNGSTNGQGFSTSRPIEVMLEDECEFASAVKRYQMQSGRMFPTCSELLEILRGLGYEKRIWKPVEGWPGAISEREPLEVFGWYSSVETPVSHSF
jgi:hypothetical protein